MNDGFLREAHGSRCGGLVLGVLGRPGFVWLWVGWFEGASLSDGGFVRVVGQVEVDPEMSFPAMDPDDRLFVWGAVLLFLTPPVGIVLLLIWWSREAA